MNMVILGSGNIASHLGKAFYTQGHRILQVYSRNGDRARALASALHANPVNTPAEITGDADLYVIAVTDHAIAEVAAQLPLTSTAIVVHCSGATDITVLHRFPFRGVIYPVQSLNKEVETPLQNIPFGVEGNNAETTSQLLTLMQCVSSKSFTCNSQQRLALHIGAVFANNFSNVLFQIAYDILKKHNLPFDLLKPLIVETAQKVQRQVPKDVQTGPAKRGDVETIEKHLEFISKNQHWVKIYQQLSEEIAKNMHS